MSESVPTFWRVVIGQKPYCCDWSGFCPREEDRKPLALPQSCLPSTLIPLVAGTGSWRGCLHKSGGPTLLCCYLSLSLTRLNFLVSSTLASSSIRAVSDQPPNHLLYLHKMSKKKNCFRLFFSSILHYTMIRWKIFRVTDHGGWHLSFEISLPLLPGSEKISNLPGINTMQYSVVYCCLF